jgi:hypothetical protein
MENYGAASAVMSPELIKAKAQRGKNQNDF